MEAPKREKRTRIGDICAFLLKLGGYGICIVDIGGIDASAWRNSGRKTLKCLRKAIPASSLSWCSSHTRETVRSPWAADFQRVPESVPGPGTGLDRSRNPTGSDQHRIRTSTGFGPEPDPDQHRIRTSTGSGPAPDPDQHRIRTSTGSWPELD